MDDKEEDLELSDVPMDTQLDDEEFEDELDEDIENYTNLLDEESKFIYDKIFHIVNKTKKITNLNDEEDEIIEEPEEDLDEEEKKRLLIDNLDPEQMVRYQYYKRTPINKSGVKKIANTVLNQSVSPNVNLVLSGVSKVFIGQIVVRALKIRDRYNKGKYLIKLNEKRELLDELKRQESLMKKKDSKDEFKKKIKEIKVEINKINLKNINENGPLLPEHIREAWRLYQLESGTAPNAQWHGQGERDGLMFR